MEHGELVLRPTHPPARQPRRRPGHDGRVARRRHAVLLLLGGALFIGFVRAGVPLGVTFSFLIAAPMVNGVALALLFGLFGWKIALLYMGLGLTVAIVAGWVIGRLKMDATWGLGARHAARAGRQRRRQPLTA